jgi:hypothetical protein
MQNSNGYTCTSCGGMIWAGTLHSCGTNPQWVTTGAPSPCWTITRCPVCEGRGNVPAGFYTRAAGASSTAPEVCQTCDGQGILKVSSFGGVEKVTA